MGFLHRNILKRVLFVWISVSILASTLLLAYVMARFDELATDLAFSEANRLIATNPDLAHGGTPSDLPPRLLQLKLYDRSGNLLLERTNPTFQPEQAWMSLNRSGLLRDGRPHVDRLVKPHGTFLAWIVPIRNRNISKVGYLEGVTQLDQNDLWLLATSLKVGGSAILLSITATAAVLYPLILTLHKRTFRYAHEVAKGHVEIVSVLGAAIAQRDSETGDHNYRVTLYAIRLAEALGPGRVDMRALILGSFLHDAGKIGIRDAVLLKPGPLTEVELNAMHAHVEGGIELISLSRWLLPARDVVQYHHEHYDGTGYPQGLSGESIPLTARLFTIVDVFDALTSSRPYKAPWSLEAAIAYLENRSGKQFDPALVTVFVGIAHTMYEELSGKSGAELLLMLMRAADSYHGLETLEAQDLKPQRSHSLPPQEACS